MSVIYSEELSYPEQLETKEWKSRRKEIIKRDEHCCVFCGKGKCVRISFNNNSYYLGIDNSKPLISSSNFSIHKYGVKFSAVIKRLNFKSFKKGVIPLTKQIGVLSAEGAFFYTVWNKKDITRIFIKNEAYLATVICNDGYVAEILYHDEDELDNIELKRVYIQNEAVIHAVHHKRYIIGKNAWEYNDNDLVTLCQECHSMVHECLPVQTYILKNGRYKVMNYTPCSRCNGTGYLPEFSHVQNGICFRCEGARFEELITDKSNLYDDL